MILLFDTETNALPADYKALPTRLDNWPRICSIAWGGVGIAAITSTLHRYVKPNGWQISPEAAHTNGLTIEKLTREGVALSAALFTFLLDAKRAEVVVGHNVMFDLNVVACELLRLGWTDAAADLLSKPYYDTMTNGVDLCRLPGKYGYKWPRLTELYRHLFGVDFPDAHDAGADVRACAACYYEMQRREVGKEAAVDRATIEAVRQFRGEARPMMAPQPLQTSLF